MWSKDRQPTQWTFLCYREGHKEVKECSSSMRKREPKENIRCGCTAKCLVHVEIKTGQWYIKYISDVHTHTLMDDKYTGMLPTHRRIDEYDKFQMTCMRSVCISTPHVYGFLASQACGYDYVGFRKRDMYNEQERDRHKFFSDAKTTLKYLERLTRTDSVFWRHIVNEEGRLQNLFWCDGTSRDDFSMFGDVVVFYATYKKKTSTCAR